MSVPAVNLEAALAALDRRDWAAVRALLAERLAEVDDPVLLNGCAEASWWLGHITDCIAARERAYAHFERADDTLGAARMAMLLFDNYRFRGRPAVAGGWLRRAARLLEDEPPCLQHGCLALRQGEAAHSTGDLDVARQRFTEALHAARVCGDADLEADALQAMGRVLILEGRAVEGLGHLDEAMLAAVEGKLGAFMTGKVYCSMMAACEELGDVRRAAEWTEAGEYWARSDGVVVFPGLCRVHRAEVLQLRGSWNQAELEARRACDELSEVHFNAALGFYAIGEIRRRIGQLDAAEDAFRRAEALGGSGQPGLALVEVTRGNVAAARASVERALASEPWNRLARAKLLPAMVEISVASGDLDRARVAAGELDAIASHYGTSALLANAAVAHGRAQFASGELESACAFLHSALELFTQLDVPYEIATTRAHLARVCRAIGDEQGASVFFDTAAEIFARLGATRDAQLVADMRADNCSDHEESRRINGLSDRELDVIAMLATGATNKQIGDRLYISQKTVARHLSNIFTKIGVSSRSAATAFAFEHDLVERPTPSSN